MEAIKHKAVRKLKDIFRKRYTPDQITHLYDLAKIPEDRIYEPTVSYNIFGIDEASKITSAEYRIYWHFFASNIENLELVNNDDVLFSLIDNIDDLLIKVLCLCSLTKDFVNAHPTSTLVILLANALFTKAFDGGMLLENIGLFYKLLDNIVVYNANYVFNKFAGTRDIRYLVYQWIDYCYCYQSHRKYMNITDLKNAFIEIVRDSEQDIEKEVYKRFVDKTQLYSPFNAFGLYMANFYNDSLKEYRIFTESDVDEYRVLKIDGTVNITEVVPFFTFSLLTRTCRDYNTLLSRLNEIYPNLKFKNEKSSNKLISYKHQTIHALSIKKASTIDGVKQDMWNTISRFNVDESILKDVKNYSDVLSKKQIIVGMNKIAPKADKYGNVDPYTKIESRPFITRLPDNRLCNTENSYDDWKITNNVFNYNPSKITNFLRNNLKNPLDKNKLDTPLFYKFIEDPEIADGSDYVFIKKILAGDLRGNLRPSDEIYAERSKDLARKMLVTNSEQKVTWKTSNGVTDLGTFADKNFQLSDLKYNSKISIVVGSSGAGKTVTIDLLTYMLSFKQNFYDQDIVPTAVQYKKLQPVIKDSKIKNNVYMAVDGYSSGSADSCENIIRASTENETSSRNFNIWNMILVDSNLEKQNSQDKPTKQKPHLIGSKSYTMVDTMGFENYARYKNGDIVLDSPIDILLYPLLTNTPWDESDYDRMNIPKTIKKGEVRGWAIPEYRTRLAELINSFNSLLRLSSSVDTTKKINILNILELPLNDPRREEWLKNDIVRFLVNYNKPKYEYYKLIRDKERYSDVKEKIEISMLYDLKFSLMYNTDVEKRKRDIQIFNLLKILDTDIVSNDVVSNFITKQHILM